MIAKGTIDGWKIERKANFSFLIFFFRGCFAPLLLDAHVKILLMYS